MILPDLAKCTRRSETRDLVRPIIVALNRMPGVRVVRNANLGPVVPWAKRFDPSARPIIAGLGMGSADVVGVVKMPCASCGGSSRPCIYITGHHIIGRLFCLEVKLPAERVADGAQGKRAGVLAADQRRWLESVRRFGGFAAVVHSADEARAAVERCRMGEGQ